MSLNGNIDDIFVCETLMIAGHAQVILGMFHNFQAPVLTLLGAIILAMIGFVRAAFMDSHEYWDSDEAGDSVSFEPMTGDLELEDIFHFHVIDGLFPFFPYAAYPILGIAVGKVLYGPSDQVESRSRHLKVLAIAGSMLLSSGVALLMVGMLLPSPIDDTLQYGVAV